MSNPLETSGIERLYGFRIIPDETIPNGYRRMEGMDIYISPGNYKIIREMNAKAILVAIGCMREMANAGASASTQ